MLEETLSLVLVIATVITTIAARIMVRTRTVPASIGVLARLASTIVLGVEQFASDREHINSEVKRALAESALLSSASKLGVKLTDDEACVLVHAALAEVNAVLAQQPLDEEAVFADLQEQHQPTVHQLSLIEGDDSDS